MGFRSSDINVTNPTPLTPSGKAEQHKMFQTSRSDTASTLKAVLPAQVSLIAVYFYGGTASDAGTTATLTITVSNNSGTISTGTVNVKTNGATSALVNMSALPNLEAIPANGDIKITAQYAETGTAATTGGPWNIVVAYVQ